MQEQFEDAVWVLFANMGFLELNAGKSLSIAYDFHDDETNRTDKRDGCR